MHESIDTTNDIGEPSDGAARRFESRDATRHWIIYRITEMDAYRDSDGRPLSEGRVPAKSRRPGVPFEFRPCPYQGSRAAVQPDRPMNVSAMNRLLSTLPQALGAFLCLRREYFSHLFQKGTSFASMWRLGLLADALPRYLAWRKLDAVKDGALPPYVADLHKLAAGVNGLMLEFALQEATAGPGQEIPAPNVNSLCNASDRMLVGKTEVCAASPALIKEVLRAYVEGDVSVKSIEPPIRELIGDSGSFFTFASAYMDLVIFRWLLTSAHQSLGCDLAAIRKEHESAIVASPNSLITAFTAWSASHSRPPGGPPGELDRWPARIGLRIAILRRPPGERFNCLQSLAQRFASPDSRSPCELLQAFHGAIGALLPGGAADSAHFSTLDWGPLAISDAVNPNLFEAAIRCIRFEFESLKALRVLESNLRAPLGYPLADGLPSSDLFETLHGASLTQVVRRAWMPKNPP